MKSFRFCMLGTVALTLSSAVSAAGLPAEFFGYEIRVSDICCTYASFLNDSAQIVGTVNVPTSYAGQGFITGPRGQGVRMLGNIDGHALQPTAVNNQGNVVGLVVDDEGYLFGSFATDPNGARARDLQMRTSSDWFLPKAVNDAGTVVVVTGDPGSYLTDLDGVTYAPLL